jgi:hypothetical protein
MALVAPPVDSATVAAATIPTRVTVIGGFSIQAYDETKV